MQQGPGVLKHDARALALLHQRRDDFTHAAVTGAEYRGVVIVAYRLVLHHVLQVADDGCATELVTPCRNQRLVHVQRNGAGRPNLPKIDITDRLVQTRLRDRRQSLPDDSFVATYIRQTVDQLGNLIHDL